ncbi:MAG: flagellar biosynthesis protein FlhF [Burkholderiales bacterium]|nr:flagellar biosynthesis protein FlhF [Burkholderiales bacterium]
MNIKRFHAATSREALAKARMAFGEGTLILSNRPTANGVEVVATTEETLGALDSGSDAPQERRPQASTAQPPARKSLQERAALSAPRSPIQEDTEQLAMSTLSFQDYVRERMLRRRHEALQGVISLQTAQPPVERDMAAEAERPAPTPVQRHNPLRQVQHELPVRPVRRDSAPAPVSLAAPSMDTQGLMQELHAMKGLIEDRFNALSWLGQARQDPIQSSLMLKLIRAGYSPTLARAVLERMPEGMDAGDSVRWLMEVLEHNLHTDAGQAPLYEQGGVFALVGSTGVGKTTTTAKLAALCARIHGPGSVGLITLDTYRVGAHDQLRSFGRMLGVVAHLAHDRAALQDLLGLLSGKKMVLIDTTGIAPRDPRKRDMLDVLDLPQVQRLLVLNASSHGDTLDDTLAAFKTAGGAGAQQAILSKIDEAVKLGPAIDALIRHQIVLRGVTNGQRVPEDWAGADAHQLIATSMRAPVRSAFDPKATELNFFFAPASEPVHDKGLVDA